MNIEAKMISEAAYKVTPKIDLATGIVMFEYGDGGTPSVLHMDLVSEGNRKRAAFAGFAQVRLVDAAAIGRTDDEGNLIPEKERVAMKRAAINRLIEHYENPATTGWDLPKTFRAGRKSLVVEAIARIKGKSYEEALESVQARANADHGGDMKKAIAFFRTAGQVRRTMEEIREERAKAEPAADVKADQALAGL